MQGQLRIDQMFAFVAVDADGTEGVCAFQINGAWVPLVGADMERVESLRPIARKLARASGRPITLVKFSNREMVEEIKAAALPEDN